jgi:hypothetical protein
VALPLHTLQLWGTPTVPIVAAETGAIAGGTHAAADGPSNGAPSGKGLPGWLPRTPSTSLSEKCPRHCVASGPLVRPEMTAAALRCVDEIAGAGRDV